MSDDVSIAMPEPRFAHPLHGGEGIFVGTIEQPGIVTEDVWVVRQQGIVIVRRWSDRECDAEEVDHPWYVNYCLEKLEFRKWVLGEVIKMIDGEEPC